MSVFTGPITAILAAGTPATSTTALTAFKAKGNSVNLEVTTVTGGAGTLTITAEVGYDNAGTVTYYDYTDTNSVWSMTSSAINSAGTYNIPLEGLDVIPGTYVRLSYSCTTAAGTIAITAINWENPKGGGISVSAPDVVVDVDNIDVNIEAVEQVHDAAVGASGFMQVVEAKTIDGSALPNAVSEGDVVRPAAEKTGNLLVTQVDADGSDAATITEDAAKGSGIGTAVVMAGHTVADFDGSAIPALGDTEGDAASAAVSSEGVAYVQITTEDGASTPLVAHDAAMAAATGGNVGLAAVAEAETLAALSTVDADGDATRLKASTSGVLHVGLTDPTGAADVGTAIQTAVEIMDDWDSTHDSAISADGAVVMLEAADVDGLAFPNAVGDEGDAVRAKASLYGVAYTATVSEDGAYIQPTMDANTRAGFVEITDGTTDATVDATTGGLDTNLAGYGGTAVGTANPLDVQLGDGTDIAAIVDEGDDISADDNGVIVYGKERAGNTAQTFEFNASDDLYTEVTTLPGGLTGYAEDAAHGDGDIGIQMLSVRADDPIGTAGTDGDYQPLLTDDHGCLHTKPQMSSVIDACNATTGWSVLSDDTANLTTATNHVYGTASLSFDKVDGAGNTVFAGIQKTISSTDLDKYFEHSRGFFLGSMYLSSVTDVAYAWFRAGTDSSNYNEWRVDDDNLVAGEWMALRGNLGAPYVSVGNGWNSAAVTYIAIGVAFDLETDVLSNILVDALLVNSGMMVSADLAASDINTPNINLHRVGGQPVNTGAGNIGNATQRVTLATDDANAAAIKTAIEIMDDWDESDRAKVNPIAGQAGVAAGSGAVDALTQRCILATDDPAVTLLGTIDTDTGVIAGDTTSLDAKVPALGTAVMAGSSPVTIATDDTMFTALDTAVDIIAGDTTSIDGKTPALGTAIMTGSVPITLATDDTQLGAVGDAADVDGNIHGQLRYIGEQVAGLPTLGTITSATATGSGAIAFTTSIAAAFELISITLHLSAAGTTSEDFTIGKDAQAGVTYDTNLITTDLSVGSVIDLALTPQSDDLPQYFKSGDELAFVWPNTEARTYGLDVQYRTI